MSNEYEQRQEAIKRYLEGEKVAQIARDLVKSRKWVYHWIKRFDSRNDVENWYKDESKAPLKTNSSLSAEITTQVVLIRQELMNEKRAQIGAISIQ